jgi:hypothetical protein
MMDFASHYNSRHTIHVKGVEKLRRALRDLEKSDAWFGAEHDRGGHRPRASDRTPEKHWQSRTLASRTKALRLDGETIAPALVRRNAENAAQR